MRKTIKNVGRKEIEPIVAKSCTKAVEELKKRRITALYDDGSEKEYRIDFEMEALEEAMRLEKIKELSIPKKYRVRGKAIVPEYDEILVPQRADPYVLHTEDGWYYFTASYPVRGLHENEQGIGYDRIVLRRARTIAGLRDAEEITIWHQKDSSRLHRYIWAPELHCINGCYYILFTGSVEEKNVWGIRPHMLKCVGTDLMNPDCWRMEEEANLHRVTARSSDVTSFTHFSLDMTCFEHRGTYYVIWAEIPEDKSNLYIASVDKNEPWKLNSEAVLLATPEYQWEMQGNVKVNEGPIVLKREGKIYVAFSASATDYTYCVGMLEIDENQDLLDETAWKKHSNPLLTSEDFQNQCGPGHNSFTVDENGNVVMIYHARPYECSNAMDKHGHYGKCEYVEEGQSPLSDPCRHARAKSINFAVDGTPILHLTSDEELKWEYRTIEIEVIIQE